MRGPSLDLAQQPADRRGPDVLNGFWLPRTLRDRILSAHTVWDTLTFAEGRECGRECEEGTPGAVTARWPRLGVEDWAVMLDHLESARRHSPGGQEFWSRLQAALNAAATRLADIGDSDQAATVGAISTYTGYSPAMIAYMLSAPEFWDLGQMRHAFTLAPARTATNRWESISGLPGMLRFFPAGHRSRGRSLFGESLARFPGLLAGDSYKPLFQAAEPPQFVAGYGAGNVPGTALIIVLLALSTTLARGVPPATVVRNSRREPIFSPLVLSALEEADPELVSSVAVLTWDYDDAELQQSLLSRSDLVIAAAGDDAIASISKQIDSVSSRAAPPTRDSRARRPRARFHAHGHKVSFSVVCREIFQQNRDLDSSGWDTSSTGNFSSTRDASSAGSSFSDEGASSTGRASPVGAHELLDAVTLLAGLDSIFWDQHGCLSSRIHFVENAGSEDNSVLDYAERLTRQLRFLADFLPRGAWPRRLLHDSFDRYKALESVEHPGEGLRVISQYADDFVVVLDTRSIGQARFNPSAFATMVNDCQGRVVVVRPVDDLMQIPRDYLSLLPPHSLQSLSVAAGSPGEALSPRFLEFAAACGAQGVTALRVVGRGAFPQLAYSWDGFLPLDLVHSRPAGHFTTIEFDFPFDAMMATYKAFMARLSHTGKLVSTAVVYEDLVGQPLR